MYYSTSTKTICFSIQLVIQLFYIVNIIKVKRLLSQAEESESENADPQKDEPTKAKRSPLKVAPPEKTSAESEQQAARERDARSPPAGPTQIQSSPSKGLGGSAPPLVHLMLSVPFARGLEQTQDASGATAGTGSSYLLSCKLFWLNDYLRSAPSRSATATDPLASHPEFFFLQARNIHLWIFNQYSISRLLIYYSIR